MRHADGDKITIATGEDGHAIFFSVKTTNARGSVLDFVIHRQGGNLGHARKTLRNYKPSGLPPGHLPAIPKPRPIPHNRAALLALRHGFQPCRPAYLESRGLSAAKIGG